MTTALEGGEGSASRSGRSLPRERPGTYCTGGWVGPRVGPYRCGKSRTHRDSIPGPSSPYPVAIPTTLPAYENRLRPYGKYMYRYVIKFCILPSRYTCILLVISGYCFSENIDRLGLIMARHSVVCNRDLISHARLYYSSVTVLKLVYLDFDSIIPSSHISTSLLPNPLQDRIFS